MWHQLPRPFAYVVVTSCTVLRAIFTPRAIAVMSTRRSVKPGWLLEATGNGATSTSCGRSQRFGLGLVSAVASAACRVCSVPRSPSSPCAWRSCVALPARRVRACRLVTSFLRGELAVTPDEQAEQVAEAIEEKLRVALQRVALQRLPAETGTRRARLRCGWHCAVAARTSSRGREGGIRTRDLSVPNAAR
jgi:hypothetical protein